MARRVESHYPLATMYQPEADMHGVTQSSLQLLTAMLESRDIGGVLSERESMELLCMALQNLPGGLQQFPSTVQCDMAGATAPLFHHSTDGNMLSSKEMMNWQHLTGVGNGASLPAPPPSLHSTVDTAVSPYFVGNMTTNGSVNNPPPAGVNGNWKCSRCSNVNYPHRTKCNRCSVPKEIALGGDIVPLNGPGGGGGGEKLWRETVRGGGGLMNNFDGGKTTTCKSPRTPHLPRSSRVEGDSNNTPLRIPSSSSMGGGSYSGTLSPTATAIGSSRSPQHFGTTPVSETCRSSPSTPQDPCHMMSDSATLLNSQDIVESLVLDFLNIGDSNPTLSAAQVLRTALQILTPGVCSLEMDDSPSSSPKMQTIGGPHYAAPAILAHPDEFKNPSSFLKIYGDPLCGVASPPVKGQNGNWVCHNCHNLNFPRRFRCNKCPTARGAEGDLIVQEYAKTVYYQHLQTYRQIEGQKLVAGQPKPDGSVVSNSHAAASTPGRLSPTANSPNSQRTINNHETVEAPHSSS